MLPLFSIMTLWLWQWWVVAEQPIRERNWSAVCAAPSTMFVAMIIIYLININAHIYAWFLKLYCIISYICL